MSSNAKWIAVAAALVTTALCAQTPPPTTGTADANAPAPSVPGSSAPARPRQDARHADARACLEFPSNLQVIQCAEKYRHR